MRKMDNSRKEQFLFSKHKFVISICVTYVYKHYRLNTCAGKEFKTGNCIVNRLKQYTSSTYGNNMYPTLNVALNYHVPTDNYTKHGLRQYTFPSLGTHKNRMKIRIPLFGEQPFACCSYLTIASMQY
jgi:hypothetical protein